MINETGVKVSLSIPAKPYNGPSNLEGRLEVYVLMGSDSWRKRRDCEPPKPAGMLKTFHSRLEIKGRNC